MKMTCLRNGSKFPLSVVSSTSQSYSHLGKRPACLFHINKIMKKLNNYSLCELGLPTNTSYLRIPQHIDGFMLVLQFLTIHAAAHISSGYCQGDNLLEYIA